MLLRFVASASAFDYFRAIRLYLQTYGKPVAFYFLQRQAQHLPGEQQGCRRR
jgi:hypothetical protein